MIQIRARKELSAIESSRADTAKQGMIALKMVARVIPRGRGSSRRVRNSLGVG